MLSQAVHRIPGTPYSPSVVQQSDFANLNSVLSFGSPASSLSGPPPHPLTVPSALAEASAGSGDWKKLKEKDAKEKEKLSEKEKASFKEKMEKLKDMNSTNLYIEG